jgi:hypothetical protein
LSFGSPRSIFFHFGPRYVAPESGCKDRKPIGRNSLKKEPNTLVISVLRKLRQRHPKFEASLGYIARACERKKKQSN